ncbi:M23 family metallopeptidase [Demequina lutea]|uniref:Murein DD-endopeptidase MepM/ murein hydrolase activator NlpD n=1 Tax=Demequina lutea TaxID=431489 RepID=A0A7Y9ZF91_9MICO|nr:M23 family metallopeptidase [Demequina lutea]NYI42880.1 murein DD-endopeptidase MepM/ murein hydrolase activator NlpD [Demequina lutea]
MKAIKVTIVALLFSALAVPVMTVLAMAGPSSLAIQCATPVERADQTVPDISSFTSEQRSLGLTITDANNTGDAMLTSVLLTMALHVTNLADIDASGAAINPFTGQSDNAGVRAETRQVLDRITSLSTWDATPPAALTAWALGTPSANLTDEWRQAAVLAAATEVVDIQFLLNMQAVDPTCQRARTVNWDGTYVVQNGWAFPVPVAHTISSPFGYRFHPIEHKMLFHEGIDIAAPCGSPIIAAKSGTITRWSENEPGYGTLIEIMHDDGTRTRYAHMYPGTLNLYLGATVTRGEPIAEVGSAGNSTGCHLHFEARNILGAPLDPEPLVGS